MEKSPFCLFCMKIKPFYYVILLLAASFLLCACNKKIKEPNAAEKQAGDNNTGTFASDSTKDPIPTEVAGATSNEIFSWIDESGNTLETRIHTPEGYTRIPSAASEFAGFIRSLSLKEAGSEVLLYNGLPKDYQEGHIAVFNFDIGNRDLQQCADSAIRVYAEYYWSIGAYDKIAFHLTNGFLMEYTKWREGNRLSVDGNNVSWVKREAYDDSYEEFRSYLDMVYVYAGTLSLSNECNSIALDDILPGDMFLKGGSPGHCVLVVDIAEDLSGNRCFLLAQGYMPAQDFHVLKNPLHEEDPWYYTSEISYPFATPLWTFEEGSLVRWGYFNNEADTSLITDKSYASKNTFSYYSETVPAASNEVILSQQSPASTVTLLAVGDNLIHTQVVKSGENKDGTYNYDHLYSNIKDAISAADIAVINQETVLGGDEFPYSGYPNFNSPDEIGEAVIDTGFDVVLHATNHTMDMGARGIENTLDFWNQYPQITVLGINKTEEDREKIKVIEKNGIKIAMLNYTYSLNGYSVPEDMPYLVNLIDKEKMAEDIKKAEELADFTIVFPHWGTEYVYKASSFQEDLTEFFYEQDVDLVIGSHPHVLEPVEWIETEIGHKMLVYYSLGNFMSYQKEAPRMLGGMANVTITKDKSGTYISDASVTPLITHYENGPADYNYAIYKLTDYNEELASRHSVSEVAHNGSLTYQGTLSLAKEVLGDWFP